MKLDVKKATDIDISAFELKVDLPTLKSIVDKLDTIRLQAISIDLTTWNYALDKLDAYNLKTDPIDLKKPSTVVKNEVVKKKHWHPAYNS